MPKVLPEVETFARIRVVGVGGAGNAAINRMIDAGLTGVEFISVNTDAQALHNSKAPVKIHIGQQTTRGLGAGADPNIGRASAEESTEEIQRILQGADMTFITFGAGGGTGSGAGPIISQISKDLGILTVGIATKPFAFEGERRRRNAEDAIANLRQNVDTLITIPNDRLLQTIDRKTPLLEAFKIADDVLRQGVEGISNLITVNGLINLDFADVKAVMKNAGSALMGIGNATGENRAIEAAQKAIESPLLEVSIDGARGVLFNITGGLDMGMHEINEAAEVITSAVDADANIIFGANLDEALGDEVRVTVIAAGFDAAYFVESKRDSARDGLAYFSKPNQPLDDEDTVSSVGASSFNASDNTKDDDPALIRLASTADDDDEVQGMDIELKDPESTTSKDLRDQTNNDQPADIWSVDDDDEESIEVELDRPAFMRLRRKKRDKKTDE